MLGITYIDSNPFVMVKDGDFWVICRNVSVELFLVEIPFDTVEAVSFQVVVTFQNGLMAF